METRETKGEKTMEEGGGRKGDKRRKREWAKGEKKKQMKNK